MPSLTVATETVALGLLFLLGGTVVIQLLTGGINLHGVMLVKAPDGRREVSPARAQMLLVTLGVAAAWLGRVMQDRGAGELPDVPAAWVAALGASHAGYLVSKLRNFISIREVIRSFLSSEGP